MTLLLDSHHGRWARSASRKYSFPTGYWLDLIVRQEGRCALSGANLIFDSTHGTPVSGGQGCHPIYAAVDHVAPGSNCLGHQIVCYDLNDLKGHLYANLFDALRATTEWQRLMQLWCEQADRDPMNRAAFKGLIRGNLPSYSVKSMSNKKSSEEEIGVEGGAQSSFVEIG